jgi:3' terminal RNA ribose 2'-O-methyltransferase Hen1
MLLTISTTHHPASDLGYLLHKHPGKFQSFDMSFGQAHAYYTEATDERCTACLLLDLDAVGLVRGRKPDQDFLLAQYVNDRPYVSSSFLSVAIAQVFGSALNGNCKVRPELANTPIPLEARLDVLPVRGGELFLKGVFEPLGYTVDAVRQPLDEQFPEWGESPYYSVTIRGTVPLSGLLSHLYVLVPVFDTKKHYYIGPAEAGVAGRTPGSSGRIRHARRSRFASGPNGQDRSLLPPEGVDLLLYNRRIRLDCIQRCRFDLFFPCIPDVLHPRRRPLCPLLIN